MIYDPNLENCRDIRCEDIKSITCSTYRDKTEIILKPVESCNFRCPYCIVSQKNDARRRKIDFEKVDLMFKNIPEFMEKHQKITGEKNYTVKFIGGEPTLIDLNKYIKQMNLHDVQQYTISTNLYRSKEYFKEINDTVKNMGAKLFISAGFHAVEYTNRIGNIESYVQKIKDILEFCEVKIVAVISDETINIVSKMCENVEKETKSSKHKLKIQIRINKTLKSEDRSKKLENAFDNLREKYSSGKITKNMEVEFLDGKKAKGTTFDLIRAMHNMPSVCFNGWSCEMINNFTKLSFRGYDGAIQSCPFCEPDGNLYTKDFEFLNSYNKTGNKICTAKHCNLSINNNIIKRIN